MIEAPIFRLRVINMEGDMDVAVGIVVDAPRGNRAHQAGCATCRTLRLAGVHEDRTALKVTAC